MRKGKTTSYRVEKSKRKEDKGRWIDRCVVAFMIMIIGGMLILYYSKKFN